MPCGDLRSHDALPDEIQPPRPFGDTNRWADQLIGDLENKRFGVRGAEWLMLQVWGRNDSMRRPRVASTSGSEQPLRIGVAALLMVAVGFLVGCASIPREAPDLSLELGKRISALEASHLALLSQYFGEKRAAVDRYIDEVWIPTFAEETLQDPLIARLWTQVCQSGTDRDRLEFLTRVGPKLQRRINEQRQSMIGQLDDLERLIADRLRGEYVQTRAINNTLTSFLSSAAEVEANRKRYLEMIGLHDADVEDSLTNIDASVGKLAVGLDRATEGVKKADTFKQELAEALAKAKAAFKPK